MPIFEKANTENGAVNVMQGVEKNIVKKNENSIEKKIYEEYRPRYTIYSNKSE